MLLALTGGQKLGIAAVAAAFVVFALASSFLLPRRNPSFPGRRLPLFVFVSVLFFAGTMTAMIVLAREDTVEAHATEETEPAETETGTTDTGATETGPGETETEGGDGGAQGDPEAGRELFASEGCGGCHVLEAAGTTGTIGPNLDQAQPTFDAAVTQITNGGGGMPPYGGQLSAEEIRSLAAFVTESGGG